MAQHVGRHPAGRSQAARRRPRRRLGEQQLLRLEKLPADRRQACSDRRRLAPVARFGRARPEPPSSVKRRTRSSAAGHRHPRECAPLACIRSSHAPTWSRQARQRSINGAVTGAVPTGRRTERPRPRAAPGPSPRNRRCRPPPFSVWKARNALSSRSLSSGRSSSASRSSLPASTSSRASIRNCSRNSFMRGSPHMIATYSTSLSWLDRLDEVEVGAGRPRRRASCRPASVLMTSAGMRRQRRAPAGAAPAGR